MKLFNARGWVTLICVAALFSPSAFAAADCNLSATPCSGAPPSLGCSGCGIATPIAHPTFGACAGGGSLNFTGTAFANTCSNALMSCTVTVGVPPFRFWAFDNFAGGPGANSGCQIRNMPSVENWFGHAINDFGLGAPTAGRWLAYQANWAGPAVDGCPAGARTVLEATAPNAMEGTAGHGAWYLLAAVDNVGGSYDFDRITGSTGCGPADVPTIAVPNITIVGRTDPCTGSVATTAAANNAADNANYGNISVNLSDVNGQWFSEAGRNAAPNLIAGFQIVFAGSAEPTSSGYVTGNWMPVRDPATPTMAMAFIPRGTAGPYTVALPRSIGNAYLAARVVYAAGVGANPTGTFDPATAGPRVASAVGGHCGPVSLGVVPIYSVTFDSVTATRTSQGVLVRWTTSFEDDVNGFVVYRTANAAGSTDAADAVMPWASAHGANVAYEFLDSGATSANAAYYVIQEQTFSGPGATSPVVRAESLNDAGGRTRRVSK